MSDAVGTCLTHRKRTSSAPLQNKIDNIRKTKTETNERMYQFRKSPGIPDVTVQVNV
jgi:hypothetical protein